MKLFRNIEMIWDGNIEIICDRNIKMIWDGNIETICDRNLEKSEAAESAIGS